MLDINRKNATFLNLITTPNPRKSTENKTKKINIVHSLKDIKEKEKIKELINIYNSKHTDNYFYTEPNIILGKQPKGPILNNKSLLKPYSFVGPSDLFQIKKSNYSKQMSKNNNIIIKTESSKSINSKNSDNSGKVIRNFTRKFSRKATNINNIKSNINIVNKIYKLIDDKSLQTMYGKIKDRIDKNNKKTISNSVQRRKRGYSIFYKNKNSSNSLKNYLHFQEEVLTNQMLIDKTRNDVQIFLSNKIHRNKENLLMNTADDIFMKMLKIKQKEKNMTISDKFRENSWNVTLRNEAKNENFDNVGFENIGNKYDPMYTLFSLKSEPEFFNKPFHSKLRIKTKQFINKENNGKNLDLEVKGKNLLEVEAKREIGFKGKKLLYKDGEADLLFYKKQNHLSTIPAEVKKSIFSEKVFVKDYGKELEK